MVKHGLIKVIQSTGYFGEDGDWLERRPANELGFKSNVVESIADKIGRAYELGGNIERMVNKIIDHEFETDYRVDDLFEEKRTKEYDNIAEKCIDFLKIQ